MSEEVLEWTKIPELETTRFGALVVDLIELETQKADLEERIKAQRSLILEEHQAHLEKQPVRVQNHVMSWRKPVQLPDKLDRTRLIQAGVTPDQLAKGSLPGATKAGYLELRAIKNPSPSTT